MRNSLLLITTLALGGCTSMGILDKNASVSAGESVFMIGVSPERYRISVFPGEMRDGKFNQNAIGAAAVFGSPEDGFIVGKAAAGTHLAIMYVVIQDEGQLVPINFKPCGDARTLVFEVPRGKVVYMGNARYALKDGRVIASHGEDLEKARRHLDERYPNLRGRLEKGNYQLLQTTSPCRQ